MLPIPPIKGTRFTTMASHGIDPQRRLIHQLPRLHCIVKASDLEDGPDTRETTVGNHRVFFFLPFFFLDGKEVPMIFVEPLLKNGRFRTVPEFSAFLR